MQIGAELLCKSVTHAVRERDRGRDRGWCRKYFQVSGLGRREPGSGIQVRVQVQDLNFIPHLYLNTRTRDLRAETWDPRMSFLR